MSRKRAALLWCQSYDPSLISRCPRVFTGTFAGLHTSPTSSQLPLLLVDFSKVASYSTSMYK